jgi:hypothetical protein
MDHLLPIAERWEGGREADLPSPKRSRFGFAQAGGGVIVLNHDPSARGDAGTSPRDDAQGGEEIQPCLCCALSKAFFWSADASFWNLARHSS